MKKREIFLVDDHPIISEGLEQLINQENDLHVCGSATDAAMAMKSIRIKRPHLVIVDISLGGKSGIELISEIKHYFPDIRILVLSMHTKALVVDRAMRAGAKGYVQKGEATNVIIKAIRTVLSGNIYFSSTISRTLLSSFYSSKKGQNDQALIETLTQREFEIFQLIAKGLSSGDIAGTLNISAKTVDAHREKIKEKLGVKNSRNLYVYAAQWLNSVG